MSLQYGELWPTNGWDPFGSLGHLSKFQRVSRLVSVTARHSSSRRQSNFAALNRGRHLYSAGRPSRWALAHILVYIYFYNNSYCPSVIMCKNTIIQGKKGKFVIAHCTNGAEDQGTACGTVNWGVSNSYIIQNLEWNNRNIERVCNCLLVITCVRSGTICTICSVRHRWEKPKFTPHHSKTRQPIWMSIHYVGQANVQILVWICYGCYHILIFPIVCLRALTLYPVTADCAAATDISGVSGRWQLSR